jgi:hypothetical protein
MNHVTFDMHMDRVGLTKSAKRMVGGMHWTPIHPGIIDKVILSLLAQETEAYCTHDTHTQWLCRHGAECRIGRMMKDPPDGRKKSRP